MVRMPYGCLENSDIRQRLQKIGHRFGRKPEIFSISLLSITSNPSRSSSPTWRNYLSAGNLQRNGFVRHQLYLMQWRSMGYHIHVRRPLLYSKGNMHTRDNKSHFMQRCMLCTHSARYNITM